MTDPELKRLLQAKLQAQLETGETIHWTASPNPERYAAAHRSIYAFTGVFILVALGGMVDSFVIAKWEAWPFHLFMPASIAFSIMLSSRAALE